MTRDENRPLTSLRGFAVIWVAFSHIVANFTADWTGLSARMLGAGYMGVDVFFILSGFILSIVYQDLQPVQIPDFFLRRILRLYPLNLFVLAGMAAYSLVHPFRDWLDPHQLPVFALMLEAYTSRPILAWNPVTWSVGIELACYLCFPVAVMGISRLPRWLLAALSAVLLIGTWWAQSVSLGWPVGWHALLRGMSSFWAGAVLASLVMRLPAPSRLAADLGEIACVAAFVVAVAEGWLRCIPAITGCLLLFLFYDRGIVSRGMRSGWCFWLGEISFSIYLLFGIMMPQLVFIEYKLRIHMPATMSISLFIVLYFVIVCSIAQFTYVTIERPFRSLARRRRRRAPGSLQPG